MLKVIKDSKGQVLVEFGLTFLLFLSFLFMLFAIAWWGMASHATQESAHIAARKYAVTEDQDKAIKDAIEYLMPYKIFVQSPQISVSKNADGERADATVTTCPTLNRIYVFTMDKITKTSSAMLEDYIRNPGDYEKREAD